jgi:hypothetical protein
LDFGAVFFESRPPTPRSETAAESSRKQQKAAESSRKQFYCTHIAGNLENKFAENNFKDKYKSKRALVAATCVHWLFWQRLLVWQNGVQHCLLDRVLHFCDACDEGSTDHGQGVRYNTDSIDAA